MSQRHYQTSSGGGVRGVKNQSQMRSTVLGHHYHCTPRLLECSHRRKEENEDLGYLANEPIQGKKGSEHVICLQPQGNLAKEPEVGSKFPGSNHPHCVANGDDSDNE